MKPMPEDWDRAVAVVAHRDDLTATIDTGIASLREHRAYLEGLGRDFDPDEFLRNMAGFVGLGAGCEYAVGFRATRRARRSFPNGPGRLSP
jgi:hypothetical protein